MRRQLFIREVLNSVLRNQFISVEDNFDHLRFPKIFHSPNYRLQNIVPNWLIELRRHLIYFIFFLRNKSALHQTYQLMTDEDSKQLFINLIVFRMTGGRHFKIKWNSGWKEENEIMCCARTYVKDISTIDVSHPLFGSLLHHENIPTESEPISLDCWSANIAYTAFKKQYYLDRNNISVKPMQDDVVIDAGGCFGDTAVFFAKSVGVNGHVYVFDPLLIHGEVIKHNIKQNNLSATITYVASAVGESSNGIQDNQIMQSDSIVNPGFNLQNAKDNEFPIISIDDYFDQHNVEKINFIKMDIEGYELLALMGAIKTIEKFKPKLAISLYHKHIDFCSIPAWINSNFPGYIFYLDHYTIHSEETVLYAVHR